MEQDEKIKNNQLIIEFLGGAIENKEIYGGLIEPATNIPHITSWGVGSGGHSWIPIRLINYNSSWDLLMPVIEKIEGLKYNNSFNLVSNVFEILSLLTSILIKSFFRQSILFSK